MPVVFPDEQNCCGQPAFNSGYWEEARRVIGYFFQVFAPYRSSSALRAPVRPCAGSSLNRSIPSPQIAGVGRRVFELTEFLVDVLGVSDTGARSRTRCHAQPAATGGASWASLEQPLTLLQTSAG